MLPQPCIVIGRAQSRSGHDAEKKRLNRDYFQKLVLLPSSRR
jgi:hypothetical protein